MLPASLTPEQRAMVAGRVPLGGVLME